MKLTHISRVVGDFVAILRRIIGERIDIQLQLASDLPPVQADVNQIEQILLSLVIKARDAIEGNGTITITTVSVQVGDAEFPCLSHIPPGHYVILQISDTGCGIDPAIRSRIFEPFFITKPSGKGTGLGLATVAVIVKQHHGYIDVQSLPGQGSTFPVYLPALMDTVAVVEDVAFGKDQLFGHETVLVVEDEPSPLHLIASALRLHGYQIEATDV
ncbi:sensor histidine kinase [Chloroflexus sp.]|uniref:sensor histidine kinase n=1 Tax=Chloroflexus sp. TaxID=1904827 RepID=UPI002ADE5138|nr:ATP-binding protein [Chloroflexus sp.]